MAGFDDILKQWDAAQSRQGKSRAHRALQEWLDANPVRPKPEEELGGERPAHRPGARRLPVEATLDLHGFRLQEAVSEIDRFLEQSRAAGLRKVLIVHGKGYHSSGAPVLRQAVLSYLQRHRLAGATGTPGRDEGGTGAVWVVIKR
ncbi:MAG: hypothetical protein EA384_15510 [Spirochaetaceae bacterium]|nr:MAG: hypothetical protein EA384_15510 [Spirochaetaceae bacterium]